MLRTNRTLRIVAGIVFILSAMTLFAGGLSLGSLTAPVALVDLVVGIVLIVSGVRLGPTDRRVES